MTADLFARAESMRPSSDENAEVLSLLERAGGQKLPPFEAEFVASLAALLREQGDQVVLTPRQMAVVRDIERKLLPPAAAEPAP